MKRAADFRWKARWVLKGKWKLAVLTGFVAMLLGDFDGPLNAEVTINLDYLDPRIVLVILLAVLIVGLAYTMLSYIIEIGYSRFNLELVDGEAPPLNTVFRYFPNWKTMIAAGFLQDLFIFLWSLLLTIPGIVASYSYALTKYILAENPDMRAREAISLSKKLMDGHRWRLFCLHLSFFGWLLLCILSLGIGYLWLHPYIRAAQAAFYRDLLSQTAPEEETAAEEETGPDLPEEKPGESIDHDDEGECE